MALHHRFDPTTWTRRRLAAGGLLVAGTLAVGAAWASASDGHDAVEARASGAGASREAARVIDAYGPFEGADMATLGQESDLAVSGTVVAARPNVRIGPPDLTYTVFTVEVDETIAGEAPERVQVAMATRSRGVDIDVLGQPEPAVGDSGVWYLSELDPQFNREGYVLTSTESLVLFDEEQGTVGEGLDEHSPLLEEAQDAGSPEAVVEYAQAVAE